MATPNTSTSQSGGSQTVNIVARLATTGEMLAQVQASPSDSVFDLRQAIAQNVGTSNFWLCCGMTKMADHDLLSLWGLSQGGDVSVIRAVSAADALPPPAEHEVELVVRDALSYEPGQSVRSYWRTVGSMRFRLLVFPRGTRTTNGAQVSAFVEPCSENLPPSWEYRSVQYRIAVLNWKSLSQTNVKVDTFSFSASGADRGWHDLVPTQALRDPESGWCGPDGSICIRAAVISIRALQAKSSKAIRCIGLQSHVHGHSCVGGLVQSLFHIEKFRNAFLSSESCLLQEPEGHIGVLNETRHLFSSLQTETEAVSAGELFLAFGRHFPDVFNRPSVPCLHMHLCLGLQEVSTDRTASARAHAIWDLFRGKFKSSMSCLEHFFELRLRVIDSHGKQIETLEDSMRNFLQDPGEPLYDAGAEMGKLCENRRVAITRWPPILSIQLERFRSAATLDSRFAYPTRLDLSEFGAEGGVYILHSVLVHTGQLEDCLFHAYVRASGVARAAEKATDSSPSFLAAARPAEWPVVSQAKSRRKRGKRKACELHTNVAEESSPSSDGRPWLCFEDATVTSSFESAAVQACFGGAAAIFEHETMVLNMMGASRSFRSEAVRAHRACALMYVQESSAAEVLGP